MGLSDGRCDICGSKLTSYFQDEKGRCYCSDRCYENALPKCTICNKPMKQWTETEDGKKYCSEECYKKSWHKCSVCNKPMKEWTETEDGKKYCSEACYETILKRCKKCNKPMREWIESEGDKFCSDKCFLESCPKCHVCGKHTESWIESDKGEIFCSDNCISESNIIMEKVDIFCNMTGLTTNEVETLLVKNSWSLDDAILKVDNYMQSLDGKVTTSKVVVDGIKNAGIYDKLAKNLSSYNTMRGGQAGFKGFVFEDMHAANASLKGTATEVIANNGLADFRILNPDGTYSFGQAKVGYNSGNIDWSAYKGQEIVIDKGNTKLIESARKAGMNVVESDISKADAERLAQTMQFESKITGNPNAPISANLHSYHQAGINSAKNGAAFGAGFSIGSNIVDLATGDKTVGEASVAIAKDTATATVGGYVIGAGTTALANTAVGGAVISGATAAGTAIAGTTVGAATIAAGTAVTTATGGAVAAVGGAIASTTVGVTVVGGATAAVTALGATAVGATIVAAAPLVAAGAVIGGVCTLGKKLFGRR